MLRAAAIAAFLMSCGGPAKPVAGPVEPPTTDPPIATPVPQPPAGDDVTSLRATVKAVDPTNPRSVEAAMTAIQKAGQAKHAAVLPDLAVLLAKPPDKRLLAAQIAATIAIPELGADPKAAIDALVPAVNRKLPRIAADTADEVSVHLALAGAAVNALGKLADPRAIDPILTLMYRAPQLFMQTRRALVACGPATVDAVRKLLGGQGAVVALIKAEKLDQYCEADARIPCEKTSLREFYAAAVTGDLGDPSLATELIAVIDSQPLPSYYVDGIPGPTQHAAAFDSLRKLGTVTVAPKLANILANNKSPLAQRILAASAYAFVAPAGSDREVIKRLGQIAADNAADDGLRQASADSFAYLSVDLFDLQLMEQLSKKYLDASAKKTAEATKATDPHAIKMATSAASAYLGYARMFQNHMARIAIGVQCKSDVGCYAETLSRGMASSVSGMKRYLKDIDSWSEEHKQALHEAVVSRAMLEISKRGPMPARVLDRLLEHVGSDARIVRQAILLALRRAAPRPCAACIPKLDAVIENDRTKSTLGDLSFETAVVRNYLRWAK